MPRPHRLIEQVTVAAMQIAEKNVRAATVLCVDESPVFRPPEHVFDLVVLTVEYAVIRNL